MELRHLRYFIAVAEELHFGRAAQRLRITQPPLSSQIQALERELGVQLFIRGRRVQLTEAGRALLAKARETIEAADAAARAAPQAGLLINGRLRVGYPAAGVFELPPLTLRTYQERFPDVGVETVVASTGAHLEALAADRLDVAFVRVGVLDRELMQFKSLQPEPLLLAVPTDHALAKLPAVPLRCLAGEPIILFPSELEPLLYRYLVTDVLGRSRVAPLVVLEATTLESACGAVAARLGDAFVGEPLARIFAMPGVVYRPLAPSPPMSRLGVAWRQDAASTTLRWFLKVLDELAEAAGTGADGRLDGAAARNGRRAASAIMAV
jgi:DNA-binding transcriptional LysR family regulator